MFGRKIEPNERLKVVELLGHWSRAIAKIDSATDEMRLTIAEQPTGMRSDEFERARVAAVALVGQIQKETANPQFWPVLQDNNGVKIMLKLQTKLDESYAHQLNLLRLYRVAADAFRIGRDDQSPSTAEFISANKAFARVLDEMGAIAGKLARHYMISAQEYQRKLQV